MATNRLKKLKGVAGTMIIKEIRLTHEHTCPHCKTEMPKGKVATAWYSTRMKRNMAIYCDKDCMDEAELKKLSV